MISAMRNGMDLRSLCQEGRLKEALQILDIILQQHNQTPINIFACLLRGCIKGKSLTRGKEVHARLIKSEFELNILLGNSLVELYAKYGDLVDAEQVFNKMPKHNVFSWTAIISAYAKHGLGEEAVKQFHQMTQSGVMPDNVTYVTVLKSCPYMEQVRKIHAHIVKSDTETNVFVESTLINMYGKWGSVEDAHAVFIKMRKQVEVSWNAMIGASAQQGQSKKALALFEQMQIEGTKPDNVTFVNVIGACSTLASIKRVIRGYALQGLGDQAFILFGQMQREGMKPDEVTFVSILSACSHGGLIDGAFEFFGSMSQDYDIIPTVEHYSCMVDLLCRVGSPEEAHDFIKKMPIEPNIVVWMSLLCACRNHGNVGLGRCAFESCVRLKPKCTAAYVQLFNIYAAAGRWDEIAKLREKVKNIDNELESECS